MNKHITIKCKNQENSVNLVKSFHYDNFSPTKSIEYLTPNELEILNVLSWFSHTFKQVFVSQKTIADKVGCCEKTVQRALIKLRKLRFITTIFRYFKTLMYHLHKSVFYNQKIRNLLMPFLPSLRQFTLSALMAISGENVRLSNYIYLNISNTIDYTVLEERKKEIKKEREVDMYKIPLEISHIRSFLTTEWTYIPLAAYPVEAIRYADSLCLKQKNIRHIWNYFISLCEIWCRNNGIKPNFELSRNLIKESKMPLRAHFFEPKPVENQREFHKQEGKILIPECRKPVIIEKEHKRYKPFITTVSDEIQDRAKKYALEYQKMLGII